MTGFNPTKLGSTPYKVKICRELMLLQLHLLHYFCPMNLVSTSSPPVSTPLVVQHNALINARFQFGPLETRLFLHLLASIGRNDTAFGLCRVEVSELLGEMNSQNTYKLVREAVEEFATRTITIEQLSGVGRRNRQPDFVVLPLLSIAQYKGGEGAVEARFNDAVIPYLLELRDNFTKAQLTELLKIKNPNSHRIYWLLREYSTFGQRVVGLTDLKAMLKLGPGYDRWDNFKVRILDRAQQELQETDLPFTYELIRQGKAVSEIRFLFAPVSEQLPAPQPPADGWEAALLAVGVAGKSLTMIKTQIEAGYYDEGYIRYVLSRVNDQVRQGKVKKQAGAVYKALADGYFLNDYKQAQATSTSKPKATVRPIITVKQREKLQNELADLRSSLKFVQQEAPEELYIGNKRQETAAEIEVRIANLQQKLQPMS
jgi:hypothetical protein